MSKKIVARARLIREILLLLTAAAQFVKVVLEILDKTVNCDARELSLQISGAR